MVEYALTGALVSHVNVLLVILVKHVLKVRAHILVYILHHHLHLACPANKFGQGCQQDCQCVNHISCNPINGACTCKSDYSGATCASRKCVHMQNKEAAYFNCVSLSLPFSYM